MTVEASIVLSVVILSLASLIRYAYTVHDTVTGSMILEETIERVRNNVDKKKRQMCSKRKEPGWEIRDFFLESTRSA